MGGDSYWDGKCGEGLYCIETEAVISLPLKPIMSTEVCFNEKGAAIISLLLKPIMNTGGLSGPVVRGENSELLHHKEAACTLSFPKKNTTFSLSSIP